MPKVVIEQSHALEAVEVKKRLDGLNEKLSTRYGIDAEWHSPTEARFKGKGASGTIRCKPGMVVVDIELPFLMTPLKSQVESRVRTELEKALA